MSTADIKKEISGALSRLEVPEIFAHLEEEGARCFAVPAVLRPLFLLKFGFIFVFFLYL
jgi:hypothetical protein